MINDLFNKDLKVVNTGINSFKENLEETGTEAGKRTDDGTKPTKGTDLF